MKLRARTSPKNEISTASLPDIVFMLLIFFMVSTVFKESSGIPVILPQAKEIQKIETKRLIRYIYVSGAGDVILDDVPVTNQLESVSAGFIEKRQKEPRIIVSMRADKRAPMGTILEVQQELRKANALNLNYSTSGGGTQ
ncbi:MAG: biopolymer transporter ExbD [Calditrichaeota bacterium]|nr:MAG: biopolymer transporter ExbD [Calditrichota bacterium]